MNSFNEREQRGHTTRPPSASVRTPQPGQIHVPPIRRLTKSFGVRVFSTKHSLRFSLILGESCISPGTHVRSPSTSASSSPHLGQNIRKALASHVTARSQSARSTKQIDFGVNLYRLGIHEHPPVNRRKQANVERPLLIPPVVGVIAGYRMVGTDPRIVPYAAPLA